MHSSYLNALGTYGQRRPPMARPQFSMGQFAQPNTAQPKPQTNIYNPMAPTTPGARTVSQGMQPNSMQPIRLGNDPASQQMMQHYLAQGYMRGADGLLYPPGVPQPMQRPMMGSPYDALRGMR